VFVSTALREQTIILPGVTSGRWPTLRVLTARAAECRPILLEGTGCENVVVQGSAKRPCVEVLPLVTAVGKQFPYLVPVVR
jgi:hypothetical protein